MKRLYIPASGLYQRCKYADQGRTETKLCLQVFSEVWKRLRPPRFLEQLFHELRPRLGASEESIINEKHAKIATSLGAVGLSGDFARYDWGYLAPPPGRWYISLKKETIEYIRGDRNAVKDEFILSRERAGASELVRVSHPDLKEPIYSLWHTKKRKTGACLTSDKGKPAKPKHTGGKKPYVILLQEDTQENLSLEASGFLWRLVRGGHVEWHTGRLVRKRDKAALTRAMMQKQFSIGAGRLRRILGELTAEKILVYDRSARAYFIDRSIARKGGVLREDKVREGVYPGKDSGPPDAVY